MVRALDDGMVEGGAEQRLKIPPNSLEAEQSLIGGLMLDALAWDKLAMTVKVLRNGYDIAGAAALNQIGDSGEY